MPEGEQAFIHTEQGDLAQDGEIVGKMAVGFLEVPPAGIAGRRRLSGEMFFNVAFQSDSPSKRYQEL